MSVRPASSADLTAFLAIQNAHADLPQWTERHFKEELSSPRAVLLAVEEDHAVAGYAAMALVAPEGQVLMIAVAPGRARRGLGTALMEGLRRSAMEKGCSRLTLEVSAMNAAALAFYRRAGFAVVGRRAKFYNDGSDAVLMDLNLE